MDGKNNAAEAARQREYIKKIADLTEGRGLKYLVVTFGCQMNERDSEKIAGSLAEMGYTPAASEEEADILVYNTCTVRDNADKRLYGRLGVCKQYKSRKKDMLIALCGCMMQEEEVIEKLQKSYPYVDVIFGTHNIFRFPELLYMRLEGGSQIVDIWKETEEIVEDLPALRKYPFKTGVNIMYGCNNFCTYCIVPYVRGRERSRDPKEIIREIERAASDGVSEVMLLGQNVNSYAGVAGEDSGLQDLRTEFGLEPGAGVTFPQLLRMIDRIEGIERVRFMTSHPKDLSDDLIRCFAELKHLCRQIHLPVQAGSDRVLKTMNRHYDSAHYMELIDKLRAACPDIAISTDIIVGFPGETEDDFMSTVELVRKVRYDSAFTFIYSVRKGTPAEKMTDQVPEEVKHQRFDRLLDVIHEIQEEKAAADQDALLPVLVEGFSKTDPDVLTGRTDSNKTVDLTVSQKTMDAYGIDRPGELIGRIIPVKIVKAQTFSLYGEAV